MQAFKKATLDDLDFLLTLEKECFPEDRQTSRRSIRHSLTSTSQEVYLIIDDHPLGAVILYPYKHTMRVYSIAVLPQYKGQGYGLALLQFAENLARSLGAQIMSLEADASNMGLIRWYEKMGYETKELLEHYYAINKNAFRMVKSLENVTRHPGRLQNIVVTDVPLAFLEGIPTIEIISSKDYLKQKRFQTSAQYRVFNFAESYTYQSKGYYISLLATARDHRVIPNVATLTDLTSLVLTHSLSEEIFQLIQEAFSKVRGDTIDYPVIFGHDGKGRLTPLSKALYQLFEAPMITFKFRKGDVWIIESSHILSLDALMTHDLDLHHLAKQYFSQKKFNRKRLKNYDYDLAILIDYAEEKPPSNPMALQKMKRAGERNGFFVEFIQKRDAHRINEFDALFIRETTSVNSHTYLMSRHAYAEGLVVIDDPWSILKCSNKLYLQERMHRAKIRMPKSMVMSKEEVHYKQVSEYLKFPFVIKEPDSAFSLGVFKVHSLNEFIDTASRLFESSEFIIAQEYIPTPFDWRIGILDNQVLFACKYLMAKDHWQIYNWSKEADQTIGDHVTVDPSEVPSDVISTALKATSFIGDGLYGVDIKEYNGHAYLIEINDNPNIDAGVEDLVSGDALYDRLMLNLKNRIIKARNTNRYIQV